MTLYDVSDRQRLLQMEGSDLIPNEPPVWDVIMHTIPAGNEWALVHWTSVTVTDNSDGVTVEVQCPAEEPSLEFLRVLTTDLLLFRERTFLYRVRIVDAQDTFNENTHTVTINAVDYAQVLKRRVLFHDRSYDNTDQFDIAWALIEYTQGFESLGITRGTTADSGKLRDLDIQQGQTIYDAISLVSKADGGFDWWVDKDLKLQMMMPRRERTLDMEWKWGVQIREIQRTSAAGEYASVIFVIGATSPTEIHNDAGAVVKTLPPPKPIVVGTASKPLGRWERTYSFNDIVTAAALQAKANWLLKDITALRATYAITLEPRTWRAGNDYVFGDKFTLRIESPPRMNMQVLVRMEEVRIALSPENEVVTLAVRAEEPETVFPIAFTPETLNGEVTPAAAPADEIVVDLDAIQHGATETMSRLSAVSNMVQMFATVDGRLSRIERSNYFTGTTGVFAPDEVWIGPDAPTDPAVELWYDPDA